MIALKWTLIALLGSAALINALKAMDRDKTPIEPSRRLAAVIVNLVLLYWIVEVM